MSASSISFVIPAYNAHEYLEDAVRSVYDNFEVGDELLVLDDGSTSNHTRDLMERLAVEPSRQIKCYYLDHRGCAETRNRGNSLAANALIFALDSDNILPAGCIRPLRERMAAEPGADMVATGEIRFFLGAGHHPTERGRWTFPAEVPLSLFLSRHDLPTSANNFLYRKAIWQRIPHPIGADAMEAWAWGLHALMAGAKLVTVPGTYYWHRQGHDSLWMRSQRTVDFNALATVQMTPYLSRLRPDDAAYVVSGAHWYDKLNKRPLRLAQE